MDRPKAAPFVGSFYDSAEVQKLFEAAKRSKLEIPIFLGAFYGLRRSEAIGLKWDAIDFQNDTITIRHTVVSCYIDGKQVQKHNQNEIQHENAAPDPGFQGAFAA